MKKQIHPQILCRYLFYILALLLASIEANAKDKTCMCIINDTHEVYTQLVAGGRDKRYIKVETTSGSEKQSKEFKKLLDHVCLDKEDEVKVKVSFSGNPKPSIPSPDPSADPHPSTTLEFTVEPIKENCGTQQHSFVKLGCSWSGRAFPKLIAQLVYYDRAAKAWKSEIVASLTLPYIKSREGSPFHRHDVSKALLCQ